MSDLEVSNKTIHDIFTERGVTFLVPDYQRPYSWGREQCSTLWEDLKNFAVDNQSFNDEKDEYFLGTIVTYKSSDNNKQHEIIDGQQRLVTLLLLLRAFYEEFNDKDHPVRKEIAECIWRLGTTDRQPDKDRAKIISEVAADEDVDEFNKIIRDGKLTRNMSSIYAKNYRYFQREIRAFKAETRPADDFIKFSKRIIDNCIFLPIVTGTQDIALRIFTTLNDRGLQLDDSDIFKAQFYKFFKGLKKKDDFVRRWKNIEEICNEYFHPRTGSKLSDLFMRYMYYLLAKEETKSDTFKGLRIFYEKDNYKVLKSEQTFEDLETLANFWRDVALRDERRFSKRVLKRLYVLSYSPYALWTNIVSLYFMGNRDERNLLDEGAFYHFLNKITAMLLMYAIVQPGVQAIRRPFFLEFQNILHGKELLFSDFRQDINVFRTQLANMKFSQTKPITRAMLAWWAFNDDRQEIPPIGTALDIEYIYPKDSYGTRLLMNENNLELLGNKSLIEKNIKTLTSSYRFSTQKFYDYLDTEILDLYRIADKIADSFVRETNDFVFRFLEQDILERNDKILNSFIDFLNANDLLKSNHLLK